MAEKTKKGDNMAKKIIGIPLTLAIIFIFLVPVCFAGSQVADTFKIETKEIKKRKTDKSLSRIIEKTWDRTGAK